MTIRGLLDLLDGAGIVWTDEEDVEQQLAEFGLSLETVIAQFVEDQDIPLTVGDLS